MRKAGGVMICTDENGSKEIDTFTCASCKTIVLVRPGDTGYLDWFTNKLICKACVDGDRSPFEEKLKRMEANAAARRSYG